MILKILLLSLFCLNLNTADDPKFHTRIIGGHACGGDKRKYAIALTSFFGMPICSASLISPFWILTAAHCEMSCTCYYASPAYIRDKYIDTDGWLPWSCPVVAVDQIYGHPDYQYSNIINDIALMRLSKPIYNNSEVDYLPLPILHQEHLTDICEKGTAVGFGIAKKRSHLQAMHVQCMDIGILPTRQCLTKLPGNLLAKADSKICIDSTRSQDICYGDSGGPLICNDMQIGIASYIGEKQCASGKPAVFTRVDRYLDFITYTLNQGSRVYCFKFLFLLSILNYIIYLLIII